MPTPLRNAALALLALATVSCASTPVGAPGSTGLAVTALTIDGHQEPLVEPIPVPISVPIPAMVLVLAGPE